jgi:hypothetical protein
MNPFLLKLQEFLRAHEAMLPIALVSGVALAAVAAALLVWIRSRAWASKLERSHSEYAKVTEASISSLRSALDGIGAQLEELRRCPPIPPPAPPRPNLNLSKRSQALRMHRHGEPAEQIAAALELPKQEVDLLLKVHRLVIRNL